jgi:hypothetical protein
MLPNTIPDIGGYPLVSGIGLSLTPASISFGVELQRAPDDGTGNPNVAAATTIFAWVTMPLRGVSYIDQLPLDNAKRFYRVRHAQDGVAWDYSLWTPGRRPIIMHSPDRQVASVAPQILSSDTYPLRPTEKLAGGFRSLTQLVTFLIPNAEFDIWESEAQPHAWTNDLTAGAVVARETSVVLSGDSALKYTNPDNGTSNGWHGVSSNDPVKGAFCVPLRRGQTYHLRVSARATVVGQGQQYRVRLSHNTAETVSTEKRFTFAAVNAWQTDVMTFPVPLTAEANTKLYVEVNRNGDATSTDFYLDALRLVEMEEVAAKDEGDSGATKTIDWNDGGGSYRRLQLTANTTLTFKGGRPGAYYVLELQQDATGSRTATWPADAYFPADTPPTLTTPAGRSDLVGFEAKADSSLGAVRYMGRSLAANYSQNEVVADVTSFDWLNSQTAGTNIPLTGLDLKGKSPKVVILWSASRTGGADGEGAAHREQLFGAFTGATGRRCTATQSQDNLSTSEANRQGRNDACLAEMNGAATGGQLDGVSMDLNGFTITVDVQSTNSRRVFALAIAGDTVKAELGSFSYPAGTGNQTITLADATLTPRCGILFGANVGTLNAALVQSAWGMGWFTSPAARFATAGGERDADTTPDAEQYGYTGECFADVDTPAHVPTGPFARADLFSAVAGSFTVNWLETATGRTGFYLVLDGVKAKVTDAATATDTTSDVTFGGLALVPRVALFMSANRATSTQNAGDEDSQWSFGAAVQTTLEGTPKQHAVVAAQKCSLAATENTVCSSGHYFNAVYANMAVATRAREGRMKATKFEPGAVTCRMDDADPVAARVSALVIGV